MATGNQWDDDYRPACPDCATQYSMGTKDERKAVVEWLREHVHVEMVKAMAEVFARKIEAGEHVEKGDGPKRQ